MSRLWVWGIVCGLSACASSPPKSPDPSPATSAQPANETVNKLGANLSQAATTPLTDLNLVSAPIPPVLADAQRAPYAEPTDGTCAALAAQVSALDAVLGADLDVPVTAANPNLVERGAGLVVDTAMRTVRNAAEAVVPFRSWVRRLSGAERYSRDVAAAIAAGTVRRAYLKGIGVVRGCSAPAAPAGIEQP